MTQIKEQKKEYMKRYRQENRERIRAQRAEFYQENKERLAERSKKYRQENKERLAERRKKYWQENKERIRAQRAEFYQENRERIRIKANAHASKPENRERKREYDKVHNKRSRSTRLLRKYGITLEEREQMILEQDNKCARCHLPFEGTGTEPLAPVVDHDHSYEDGDPDSIKAIIHQKCNLMMGSHGDDVEELELSIDYGKKYSKVV